MARLRSHPVTTVAELDELYADLTAALTARNPTALEVLAARVPPRMRELVVSHLLNGQPQDLQMWWATRIGKPLRGTDTWGGPNFGPPPRARRREPGDGHRDRP